jgi:hypothetical protein
VIIRTLSHKAWRTASHPTTLSIHSPASNGPSGRVRSGLATRPAGNVEPASRGTVREDAGTTRAASEVGFRRCSDAASCEHHGLTVIPGRTVHA